jgi:hypothetical protein
MTTATDIVVDEVAPFLKSSEIEKKSTSVIHVIWGLSEVNMI